MNAEKRKENEQNKKRQGWWQTDENDTQRVGYRFTILSFISRERERKGEGGGVALR